MSETFIGMPGVVSDDANAQAHTGGWRTTVSIPEDTLRWGPTFPQGARKTLANTQMRRNLGHATRTIRTKRGQRVAEMPDWEDLRNAAEAVKFEVESRMPELLEEFERNVTARGGIVHWARDKHDMPSHIVVPAIHRNRSEVRGIFLDRMEDAPRDLSDDPTELTAAARSHLRKKFLHAKVAVSGTNMGVAETGTVSIFESEGNGRMCLTLPDTLITLMGIEKLVPRFQDIEIFSQLLPRSATGERMNPYTSMWTGVTPGDGPQEFHLILMDNGRTKVLADPIGRQALACIRCGSCMNICPVYQHTSGHAYGSVYPGPIGAILTPQLTQGLDEHDPVHTLPFASSLCGACGEVCPVKIDIPTILIHMRARTVDVKRNLVPDVWDLAMGVTTPVMSNAKLWKAANMPTKATRLFAKKGAIGALPFPASLWTRARDLPVAPKETFREWWKRTHKDSDANAPRTDAPATGIPLASEHGMTTNTTPKEA